MIAGLERQARREQERRECQPGSHGGELRSESVMEDSFAVENEGRALGAAGEYNDGLLGY